MNRFIKKAKGITLIALVITVIILLIISAVAVSAITGNSGLFSKANEAGTLYNESAKNEANEISELMAWWEDSSVEEKVPEDADVAIKTVNELIAFRDAVNAGDNFLGKKVYLMSDLDLGNIDNFGGISSFAGTFDGMGHTINNLRIEKENERYAAFFHIVEKTACVRQLQLDNVVVSSILNSNAITTGYLYTAALASAIYGKIERCAVLGGMVQGIISSTSATTGARTGGLVGSGAGIIDQCYNAANVVSIAPKSKGFSAQAAGIACGAYSVHLNCYNAGTIHAEGYITYVGGITALTSASDGSYPTTIANCYNIGNVSANGTSNYVGLVTGYEQGPTTYENSYALNKTMDIVKVKATGVTTTPTKVAESELKNYSQTLGEFFKDDINGINFGYPILVWQNSEKVKPVSGDLKISSVSELLAFRDSVNAGNDYFGKKVYLMTNLDLASIDNFEGMKLFSGTFDGKGHTISNLKIQCVDKKNCGFFDRLEKSGIIQNLNFENANVSNTLESEEIVTGIHTVGSFVGISYGKIKNCINYSGKVKGEIKYSKNTTDLVMYSAGISGRIGVNAIIDQCANFSEVTTNATSYAGISGVAAGITGWNYGMVSNSYNMGAVYASGTVPYSAGIAGITSYNGKYYSSMLNCYNTGNITAVRNTWLGAFSGYDYKNTAYANCRMVSGIAGAKTAATTEVSSPGITKETAAVLKTKASDLGVAFKPDTNNINNGFPILEWQ